MGSKQRVRNKLSILTCGLLLHILPINASAQDALGGSEAPIEITADSLDVHQDRQVAIFTGDVVAIQEDMTLKSDRMTVFYRNSEQVKENKNLQRISKIDVDGNVFLTTPKETAKGDKGIYYVDQKIIRLFNNVVLTQENNIIKGDGLEYNMQTKRSRVVSRTAAKPETSDPYERKNGRVKGVFVPSKE